MKNHIIKIASIILLMACTCSCIEEISPLDQQNTREGGQLVIFGRIINDQGPHEITVGRVSERDRVTEPVSGAEVVVYDDAGNSEECSEWTEGTYSLQGNRITGEVGKSYYVEVTLASGERYRSLPEKMHPLPAKDSLYFTFTPNNGLYYDMNIMVDTRIQAGDDAPRFRWAVGESFLFSPTDFPDPWGNIPPPCYVTRDVAPDQINLFNGAEVNTLLFANQLIAKRRVDHTFIERHYLFSLLTSLSPNSYDYWERVGKAIQGTGSLFDTPPAPVFGNLKRIDGDTTEIVLGYFEANAVDTTFLYTLVDDMPTDFLPYCKYSPFRRYSQYPDECLNCLDQKGSSYEKPYFFRP